MEFSRRQFGKITLAGLPAMALAERPLFGAALATQAKPNSKFGGVQIGIITYSYGGMPDQGGEATLKYVVDSGINAIELMDGPAEQFAGRPAGAGRGGFGPGGGPGGPGGGRGPGGPGGGAPGGGAPGSGGGRGGGIPENASYNGQPCSAVGRGGPGGPGGGRPGGGPGGRAGGAAMTPEQQAEAQAAAQEAATKLRDWRTTVSMDKFKQLRKLYNDAGVTIYAYKSDGMQKNMQTTDGEWEYLFNVCNALGATHTTMELPAGDSDALLRKIAGFAEKAKVQVAFHTHGQGRMDAFDHALSLSKAFLSGVDLGHYVAAGNVGGDPIQFLQRHHDRMISFHIKDRTLPEHCGLNLAWGTGDTPVTQILQAVQKNRWTNLIPTIELEYPVPQGSDKVQEAKKCVEYCRRALEG